MYKKFLFLLVICLLIIPLASCQTVGSGEEVEAEETVMTVVYSGEDDIKKHTTSEQEIRERLLFIKWSTSDVKFYNPNFVDIESEIKEGEKRLGEIGEYKEGEQAVLVEESPLDTSNWSFNKYEDHEIIANEYISFIFNKINQPMIFDVEYDEEEVEERLQELYRIYPVASQKVSGEWLRNKAIFDCKHWNYFEDKSVDETYEIYLEWLDKVRIEFHDEKYAVSGETFSRILGLEEEPEIVYNF